MTFNTRALIALAVLPVAALAADPMTNATGGQVDKTDRTFIEKASIGGMTEVEAGTMARQKATNPDVKAFAEKMIADHTKANTELQKIATAKGVTPPGTLDKSHKSDVESLSKKEGADFDKAYTKAMVSDHKTTVSDFEKAAKSAKDPDLRNFASATLPTLQGHLKMAQDLEKSVK